LQEILYKHKLFRIKNIKDFQDFYLKYIHI
jgi:hypothetical protein